MCTAAPVLIINAHKNSTLPLFYIQFWTLIMCNMRRKDRSCYWGFRNLDEIKTSADNSIGISHSQQIVNKVAIYVSRVFFDSIRSTHIEQYSVLFLDIMIKHISNVRRLFIPKNIMKIRHAISLLIDTSYMYIKK